MASPIPIPRSDLVRIPSCGNGSSASSSSSPPGRPSASHPMLLKLDGSHRYTSTVCPGSSDTPEKILNKFASENEAYTIF